MAGDALLFSMDNSGLKLVDRPVTAPQTMDVHQAPLRAPTTEQYLFAEK